MQDSESPGCGQWKHGPTMLLKTLQSLVHVAKIQDHGNNPPLTLRKEVVMDMEKRRQWRLMWCCQGS
eukprot:scaffold129026_cov65-Attheya_sp.AAC.1